MLMTQAAFARKVKKSRQYINKLVDKGIIPVYDQKRVDMDEAERLMIEHEDPHRDAQREANAEKRKPTDLLSAVGTYDSEADMSDEERAFEREKRIEQLRMMKEEAKSVGADEDDAGDVETMSIKQLNIAILKQDLRIKRAKADESEKSSVPLDEVNRSLFAASRIIRDGLLGIPARLAARIAAESDAHKCRTMMEQEIIRQLQNISEVFHEL